MRAIGYWFVVGILVTGCIGQSQAPQPKNLVGTEELAWLPGTWVRKDPTAGVEELSFSFFPKKVVETYNHQVGRKEDADLPFPTACNYRYSGSEFVIYRSSETSTEPSENNYTYDYIAESVELVTDSKNDSACSVFLNREKARVQSHTLLRRFPLTKKGPLLIQTVDGTYEKKP